MSPEGTDSQVPDRFRGAWRRVGLQAGGDPVPSGDVVWVQVSRCFADIRLGAAETRAFAGTSRWAAPSMVWQHELHVPSVEAGLADAGELGFDGEELIETGTWTRDGRVESYVEHWRRVGDAARGVAVCAPGGRLVSIGGHAVLVTGRGACRWEFRDGIWTIGPIVGLMPPVDAPRGSASAGSDAEPWLEILRHSPLDGPWRIVEGRE